MGSWVYIFSKFTPELLLFEALIIFILCSSYAAFWILKKHRLRNNLNEVPSSVVKQYISGLITNARSVHAQLFGSFASEQDLAMLGNLSGANFENADPALVQKMSVMEAQLAQQSKDLQDAIKQKEKIEKELLTASKKGGVQAAAVGSGSVDTSAVKELQNKLITLEGKLLEYSVIEDDLANLKRLQQENQALKAALANMEGGAAAIESAAATAATAVAANAAAAANAVPAAAPAAEPAAPAPAVETPAPAEVAAPAAAAATPLEPETPASSEVTSALSAAESAIAAKAGGEPNFENLVNQVEESLQPSGATAAGAAAPAPAQPAPEAAAPAAPAAPKAEEKSDADLIAEFEKMLSNT